MSLKAVTQIEGRTKLVNNRRQLKLRVERAKDLRERREWGVKQTRIPGRAGTQVTRSGLEWAKAKVEDELRRKQ